MKPSARIQASIEIFEKGHNARVPLDTVVGDYIRARRYIGSKDRADIADRTYSVTRAHARLGWWLERAGAGDTPRNRLIAFLALKENMGADRIGEIFCGEQYAPTDLTNAEKELIAKLVGQNLDHPDMPPVVSVECPPQHEAALREYFGKGFEDEMRAMMKGAPLDLRVNTFLIERDKARESLIKDGRITTDATPFSPWGLRARGKAHISRSKAFVKGWVEIQDEGSQLIAHVCNAMPGMQVLDYCAGGGGKTLALGAAMKRKGRIVAMDSDEKRLAKGKERFKKAQLSDIIEIRPLSDEKQRKWLKRQKDKFDVVLLDVPCTGSGTWRRNPDSRWRQYGPALAELIVMQQEILEKASPCVKPGGRLVYATCSLLPEENEKQVEKFLATHPEFEILPVILSDSEGSGAIEARDPSAALRLQDDSRKYMRLTPLRHNTDGFFAAVLVKKS
jgi:16S rRNA (cytosine967-C5)-methyltransferase